MKLNNITLKIHEPRHTKITKLLFSTYLSNLKFLYFQNFISFIIFKLERVLKNSCIVLSNVEYKSLLTINLMVLLMTFRNNNYFENLNNSLVLFSILDGSLTPMLSLFLGYSQFFLLFMTLISSSITYILGLSFICSSNFNCLFSTERQKKSLSSIFVDLSLEFLLKIDDAS